jgi:hypothetical protein
MSKDLKSLPIADTVKEISSIYFLTLAQETNNIPIILSQQKSKPPKRQQKIKNKNLYTEDKVERSEEESLHPVKKMKVEDEKDKGSYIFGPFHAIEAEEEGLASNMNANIKVVRKEEETNNLKEKIISMTEDNDMRIKLCNEEINTIREDAKIIVEDDIEKEDNKRTNNIKKGDAALAEFLLLSFKIYTQKVNIEKEDNIRSNNIEKDDGVLAEDDIAKEDNKVTNNIEKGDDSLVEDDIAKEDNKGTFNIEKGDVALLEDDIEDVGRKCERFYPSIDNLLKALQISLNFEIPPGYIITTSYCPGKYLVIKTKIQEFMRNYRERNNLRILDKVIFRENDMQNLIFYFEKERE